MRVTTVDAFIAATMAQSPAVVSNAAKEPSFAASTSITIDVIATAAEVASSRCSKAIIATMVGSSIVVKDADAAGMDFSKESDAVREGAS